MIISPPKINLTVITMAVATLLFVADGQAAAVAYWSFDDDFTDASGNGNNLSAGNGSPAVTTTAGEFAFGGGAANFAGGGERLDLSTHINFSSTDAWSVSFWVRKSVGAGNDEGMILGDPNQGGFIWYATTPGGVRFRHSATTSGGENFASTVDNQFQHWVITADGGGQVTAYRNNTSLGTGAETTTFNIEWIGHAYNNAGYSLNGQLDEVYVFDEALNSTTVAQLYNNTYAIPEPGIFALIGIGSMLLLLRRR